MVWVIKINFGYDKQHQEKAKLTSCNVLPISIIRYICELINN